MLEQCSAQSELSQRDHTHPGFSAPTGMIEAKVKWKELENGGNKWQQLRGDIHGGGRIEDSAAH